MVYNLTWVTHLDHLERVLLILKQHVLFLKLSKYVFGMKDMDYLGHTISGGGVAMDKDKVQSIIEWPVPANVKQLQGSLGLTGNYHYFIKSYS